MTPLRALFAAALGLAATLPATIARAEPPAAQAASVAAAAQDPTPAPPPDPARTGIGFSPLSFVYTALPVGIGVANQGSMEGINDHLRELDLDELPSLLSTVSVALTAAYPVGLVVEPMYRFAIAGTDEATLTMHQLFLNLGWLVHARGDQVVFPFLGVGYGNTALGISTLGVPDEQSFHDVVRAPEDEALLANHSLLLQVGLASALWGSGNGDFIGLRMGAFVAPLSSGWKRRGYEVTGGPSPPMNGFYLMGHFGLHDPRWREQTGAAAAAPVRAGTPSARNGE